MAEEKTLEPVMKPGTAAAGPAGGAQFQIQKLYTKDVSFELPNASLVFQQEGHGMIAFPAVRATVEAESGRLLGRLHPGYGSQVH